VGDYLKEIWCLYLKKCALLDLMCEIESREYTVLCHVTESADNIKVDPREI
jgi:hypothetical protein